MLIATFSSCINCKKWGAKDFGNRITLLEGDKESDRMMVYCTTNERCCYSGIPLIPSRAEYHSRYVLEAKSKRNLVLVKTMSVFEEGEIEFWIINKDFELDLSSCNVVNCDSILKKQIKGPFNTSEEALGAADAVL